MYAIGEMSGPPMFTQWLVTTQTASTAISPKTRGSTRPIESAFTDPQIGHVGLTEKEARNSGYDVGVGWQNFAEQGKSKAEGFVKLVTDAETGELLGGHVVSERGAEIVHELVPAIELRATAEDIANTMHIPPTLPGSINSAAGGVHEPS